MKKSICFFALFLAFLAVNVSAISSEMFSFNVKASNPWKDLGIVPDSKVDKIEPGISFAGKVKDPKKFKTMSVEKGSEVIVAVVADGVAMVGSKEPGSQTQQVTPVKVDPKPVKASKSQNVAPPRASLRASSYWDGDERIYTVVMNHEEQYSIWPADRECPLGWQSVGKTGTKSECLDYIEQVWTDMRPLSLRKKMEEIQRQQRDY
jgi:MbtH protein